LPIAAPTGAACGPGRAWASGHRRLSIIDLEGGAQPMVSPDRRVVITFNGEIYNYQEVRAGLEQQGHVFQTNSDTETILAAWRQWDRIACSG
jgi:asparagine synthase (glutamine-hydrolysing)